MSTRIKVHFYQNSLQRNIFVKRPEREPDYQNFTERYWFEEMICQHKMSNLVWDEAFLLSICPETNMLMFMDRYVPMRWAIVTNLETWQAYQKWSNDKANAILLKKTE